MKIQDFSFELAPELIAQYPLPRREDSRLLILERSTGSITHSHFKEFVSLISPDTLIVFNDSLVRKTRLRARIKESGKEVEFLLLKEIRPGFWKTLLKRSQRYKKGVTFSFPEAQKAVLTEKQGEFIYIRFNAPFADDYLQKYGHVPLPPYIKRKDKAQDQERYQTVYARHAGSAAAPTAGFHFSKNILEDIKNKGIQTAFVTLHVGTATFLPIRTENIEKHNMHEEEYYIPEKTATLIESALTHKKNILAVGTTTVRVLESSYKRGKIKRGKGNTRLFIYPGYEFKVVSQLITNFHTPRSSLLLLVCAFAGKDLIFKAYRDAMLHKYRFYSYGDAMFII